MAPIVFIDIIPHLEHQRRGQRTLHYARYLLTHEYCAEDVILSTRVKIKPAVNLELNRPLSPRLLLSQAFYFGIFMRTTHLDHTQAGHISFCH